MVAPLDAVDDHTAIEGSGLLVDQLPAGPLYDYRERNMRALVCAMALATFWTAAAAETPAEQAAKRRAALLDENARHKECMKLWDRSTHMTKRDWENTCRRVDAERVKYLREQGYGAERMEPTTRSMSPQM